MGLQMQDLASEVPLHQAQTQLAIANARAAVEKNKLIAAVAGADPADLRNPLSSYFPYVVAGGLGGSYNSALQGLNQAEDLHNRLVLSDPTKFGSPEQTAAQQGLSGRVATPVTVGDQYVLLPGMPAQNIQESPQGAAKIAKAQAQANQANAVASLDQPYTDRQSQILAALTADGVSLPGGLRGQRQIRQTLAALDEANPGASPQEIADMVKGGRINLATQTTGAKAFATGRQGQQAQSFGVALAHLDTLQNLIDSLDNTASPLWNRLANTWKTQTGQAAPTNFNAARQIVGAEIMKAIVAGGGGEAERQQVAQQLNNASSPQQLNGVIDTYKQLLTGQLTGLAQTYRNSTGRADFESILTPEGRAYYLQHVASQQNSPSAAPGAPATAPSQLASPSAAAPQISEGAIAVNRATGQRLILRGGRWLPLQ